MSSKARTILGNIKTALTAINGAGGYTHDLSATGRVQLLRGLMPGMVPGAIVYPIGFSSEHNQQLGRYTRKMSVMVVGVVAGTTDSPSDRLLAAFDLLSDICMALEADRTLGGTVLDVIVSNAVMSGDELDAPTLGAAYCTVDVEYKVNSGAGV